MKTLIEPKPPLLESMIVCGGCCKDQFGCNWDHWHIYVNDQHIMSVNFGEVL